MQLLSHPLFWNLKLPTTTSTTRTSTGLHDYQNVTMKFPTVNEAPALLARIVDRINGTASHANNKQARKEEPCSICGGSGDIRSWGTDRTWICNTKKRRQERKRLKMEERKQLHNAWEVVKTADISRLLNAGEDGCQQLLDLFLTAMGAPANTKELQEKLNWVRANCGSKSIEVVHGRQNAQIFLEAVCNNSEHKNAFTANATISKDTADCALGVTNGTVDVIGDNGDSKQWGQCECNAALSDSQKTKDGRTIPGKWGRPPRQGRENEQEQMDEQFATWERCNGDGTAASHRRGLQNQSNMFDPQRSEEETFCLLAEQTFNVADSFGLCDCSNGSQSPLRRFSILSDKMVPLLFGS